MSSFTSSILSGLWSLLYGLLQSVISDISGLLGNMSGGFGNSIITMFQSWGQSLYGLGIWEPVIFVVVIGVAGAVIYLFFDAYGIEKDMLRGEEDV